MTIAGKWATSRDDETYVGLYDTREEALASAKVSGAGYIGQFREPKQPENYIDVEGMFEHIACQEDYTGDWAEDYLKDVTEEQEDDLRKRLKKVMGEWLDAYDLRPTWGIIGKCEEVPDA